MKTTIALSLLALASLDLHAAATDADPAFNNPGGRVAVYYDLGGGKAETMQDTAIAQSTGAIYSVGSIDIATGRASAMLVKRLSNGSPDTSFATGTYSNSWMRFDSENSTGSAQFNAVAFDGTNTGSVIVAGFRDIANGQRCAYAVKVLDNAVMKGVLDGGFANQGTLTYCNGYDGSAMAFSDVKVLSDGKILLLRNGSNGAGEKGGALIRLLPNGQFDTSFNVGGISGFQGQINIDVRAGKHESTDRIAVTPAGYVVGGSSQYSGNDWDAFAVRVLANGTKDAAFGNGGMRFEALDDANTQKEDRLADMVSDASGRVLLLVNSNKERVRVIRLGTSGVRDSSFNATGIRDAGLSTTYNSGNAEYSYELGAALGVNSAQQIWIVGSLVQAAPGVADRAMLAMARLGVTGGSINSNVVKPYGQNEYGATASIRSDSRVLVGTRLRTSALATDFDFGFLQLLGTP